MTQTKSERGFTIVELLIVIVVIGILAAITLVAYNGIQARANKTAAESTANSVYKKIVAYQAIQSAYPVLNSQLSSVKEAELESGTNIGVPAANTGKNTVAVWSCGITGTGATRTAAGIMVGYWDYTASSPAAPTTATAQFKAGDTSGTCTAWPIT